MKYPAGYMVPDLLAQAEKMGEMLGIAVDYDMNFARERLPMGAENYFVIPPWQTIAETYNEAVEKLFVKLAGRYGKNIAKYLKLEKNFLFRDEDIEQAIQKIWNRQGKRKMIVIPAQLGILEQGPENQKKLPGEFCLGIYEVLVILLAVEGRLEPGIEEDCLDIICGDKSTGDFDDFQGEPIYIPCFSARRDKQDDRWPDGRLIVRLDAQWQGHVSRWQGKATGFLQDGD